MRSLSGHDVQDKVGLHVEMQLWLGVARMRLATAITLSAGGPGSGCNPEAGHCGRHVGQSKGASVVFSKLTDEDKSQLQDWKKEYWNKYEPGTRAFDAIKIGLDIAQDADTGSTRSSFYTLKDKSGTVLGAMELDMSQSAIWVDYLAAHPEIVAGERPVKGVGTHLMLEAANIAAQKGVGIKLHALEGAESFYEHLGLKKVGIGNTYHWRPEDVRLFAKSGKVIKASMDKQLIQQRIKKAMAAEKTEAPLISRTGSKK